MKFDNSNHMPVFEDDHAAKEIRDWFAGKNQWQGMAFDAYRGRGCYDGAVSYDEDGRQNRENIYFSTESESLGSFMKSVEETVRYTPMMEELPPGITKHLDSLYSTVNYSHIQEYDVSDQKTSVLYLDRKGIEKDWLVNEVVEDMYDLGTELRWFGTVAFYNGKVSHVVTPEIHDKTFEFYKNNETAKQIEYDLRTLVWDVFEPAFYKYALNAGYEDINGIVFTTAAPGYDRNGKHYHGSPKAIYDDIHNVVIIQTEPLSEERKKEKKEIAEEREALREFRQEHGQTLSEEEKQDDTDLNQESEGEKEVHHQNAAEDEAKRIRKWCTPGDPEAWKGIALDSFRGSGIYEGTILSGSEKKKFELIQRHNGFTDFLTLIEKLSFRNQKSILNEEATLAELCYVRSYENDWDDTEEDPDLSDLDAGVRSLLQNIRKHAQENQETLMIQTDLAEGAVENISVNGQEITDDPVYKAVWNMSDYLQEVFWNQIDQNQEEYPDSFIIRVQRSDESGNTPVYDAENNALILNVNVGNGSDGSC